MTRTKETGNGFLEEEAFELEGRKDCVDFPQPRKCIPYITGTKYTIVRPDVHPHEIPHIL